MEIDWTVNRLTGRANDSEKFHKLVSVVDRILRQHRLGESTESTARFIIAQLAHQYRMAPRRESR